MLIKGYEHVLARKKFRIENRWFAFVRQLANTLFSKMNKKTRGYIRNIILNILLFLILYIPYKAMSFANKILITDDSFYNFPLLSFIKGISSIHILWWIIAGFATGLCYTPNNIKRYRFIIFPWNILFCIINVIFILYFYFSSVFHFLF